MTGDAAPGRLVELDGVTHHVVVRGAPGPVVVLESGLGGGTLEWEAVASSLEAAATVVRRDRPGLGWSGPGASAARTAVGAACELQRLLKHLGLQGPYVLVGHSLGGLHVRAFACLFPHDVAGVVLVDPSHEEVLRRIPSLKWLSRLQAVVFRLLLACGALGRALLLRIFSKSLADECAKPLSASTAEVLRRTTELARRPGVLRTIGAEFAGVEPSYRQLRELSEPFPPVPLRIISRGRPPSSGSMAAMLQRWQALHAELLRLSPDSTHLIAERSGHLVPLDQPEVIVAAIEALLLRPAAGSGVP